MRGISQRAAKQTSFGRLVVWPADVTPVDCPVHFRPVETPSYGSPADGDFYFDDDTHAPTWYDGNAGAWRTAASLEGAQTLSGALTISGAITASGGIAADADELTVGGVKVDPELVVPVRCLLNADCIDQAFFIADRAYQVTRIDEIHATAGTDGSAVNLQVTKDTGTDAPGAGTDLLTNNTNAGFDLKGTANTVQNGALTGTTATLQLAAGNRLSLDFAGTVTSLAGLVVTVVLKPI